MKIDLRDPKAVELIDPAAELEQLATGFHFLEGPVWHAGERQLTFSDIPGDTLYRWSSAAGVRVLRRPSHKANGNTVDHQGRLLTCEHATSRVTRTAADGQVEVLASHFHGKELNSPNDVVVKRDGAVYFTDPPYGRISARVGVLRPQELDFHGVYRLEPDGRGLTLLVDDFERPNGLCFSLDERTLFVDDTARGHIRAFDVQADGTLAGGRVWAELTEEGVGGPDGMKIDCRDNLYCAGPGGIHIFDSAANYLAFVAVPEQTANLCFGDDDLRSLYITATTSLYRVRVRLPGNAH